MLLSFLTGTALVGVGIVIGVNLNEHKIVTLKDLRTCADKISSKSRELTGTNSQPQQTQEKTT